MATTSGSRDYGTFDALAQEFADRYRRGERPCLDEYVDRCPEFAAEIREMFPALVEMERAEGEALFVDPPRPAPAAPPLSQVGDYRVLREVGRGGMGVVYEAEQVSLGRRVALKVLPRGTAGDRTSLVRFRREARSAARLHHTNIVPVFEVGQDGGVVFYAMQFIQGQGLDLVIDELARLRERSRHAASRGSDVPARVDGVGDSGRSATAAVVTPGPSSPLGRMAQSLLTGRFGNEDEETLDATEAIATRDPADVVPSVACEPAPSAAARLPTSSAVLPGGAQLSSAETPGRRLPFYRSVAQIGLQAAQGLAYAHARGVVHRDVKPSNLLLDTAGVVWITDFGLAKADDDGLTQTGDILGTIRYMAPERFRGESDARADVYALGLTLYELLTLRPAFEGADRLRLIERIKAVEPDRPRALDPRIPRDLETVVLKAIEKEPSRRYPSAEAMAEDLRRFLADEPVRARRTTAAERYWRWARRNPAVATLGAVLTVLLVASAAASALAAGHFNRLARDNRAVAERERRARQDEQAARTEVESVNTRLLAEQDRVRLGLYASRMNMLQVAWAREETPRVNELLDATRPEPGGDDLRGFEWHYWQRRMRPENRVFRRALGMGGVVALSRDGSRMLGMVSTRDPGYQAQRIQVMDTADGRERFETTFFRGGIGLSGSAFARGGIGLPGSVLSADGARVASYRAEARAGGESLIHLRVWDVDDGRERFAVSLPTRSPANYWRFIALDDRGARLALATVGPDTQGGEVFVWDVDSGAERLRRSWDAPWGASGLDLRGDGKAVAVTLTAAYRGDLRLWDVDDGREVRVKPPAETALLFEPSFVGDGSRLLFLWSQARESDANPASVSVATADAATGRLIATTETGLRLAPGTGFQSFSAVSSDDGQRIAVKSAFASSIQVLEVPSGTVLFRVDTGDGLPSHVAFPRRSDVLLVVNSQGAVREYALDPRGPLSSQAVVRLPGCLDAVVSPDGRRVASFDGRDLTVVDADTGSVVGRYPVPLRPPQQFPGRLVVSPDSSRMAAWGEPSAVKEAPAGIGASLALEDGRYVVKTVVPGAAAARDGRLRVGDAVVAVERDGRRVGLKGMTLAEAVAQIIGPTGTKVRLVVRPGGTSSELLYEITRAAVPGIVGAEWPTLLLWDAASGRVTKVVLDKTTAETEYISPVFRPDGRAVALIASIPAAGAAPASERLQVRDAEGGRVLADRELPPGKYRALAFTPSGKTVVLAVSDPGQQPPAYRLVEVDPTTGGVLRSVPVGAEPVDRVLFRPDGARVALLRQPPEANRRGVEMREWPGGAEAWRADFGTGLARFRTQASGQDIDTRLVFSPDGRRLALTWPGWMTRSQIRVWETEAGYEVLAQPLEAVVLREAPCGLAFGASGRQLLVTVMDRFGSPPEPGRVQVLDATPLAPEIRAADLLDEHAREYPFPSERLERLLADPALDAEARAALPAVAATRVAVFSNLRTAAMELALAGGKPTADYERGLRYAEEALRLRPDDPDTNGILAAAFRLGRDDARAAAALERRSRRRLPHRPAVPHGPARPPREG
ncbi:MAG: protein kinase [Isosphaeraceae bacterium]